MVESRIITSDIQSEVLSGYETWVVKTKAHPSR